MTLAIFFVIIIGFGYFIETILDVWGKPVQKSLPLSLEEKILALEAEDAKLDKEIAALEANEDLVKEISSEKIREELREKLRTMK